MKAKKYYAVKKIHGNNQTPKDFLEWSIRDVSNEKHNVLRKRLKLHTSKYSDYLLIEKTVHPNHTESVTDLFPIDNESQLLKKIGKTICYDYTGIAQVMVWKDGELFSWKTFQSISEMEKLFTGKTV